MTTAQPASRLDRRLDVGDAVVVGLGAMIGAGVFSAIGPATAAAGGAALIGLAVAAVVAWCNATSSAQLAAAHPQAGGTYVYGRARLGHVWGFLAGFMFVIGKTASCVAMALTFGDYAWPDHRRLVAILAVAAVCALNLGGITRTVFATRVILAIVLASLAVVVIGCLFGGRVDAARIDLTSGSVRGTLQSAALLFFAFAGYARLATLGEEVRDPAVTIPRAIPRALALTLAIYTIVLTSALLAAGPAALAVAKAPLAAAVTAGDLHALAPVVRIGAAVASFGVLLSLMLGVSRTAFAMAAERDLPDAFAKVHPRTKVPHRAELLLAIAVIAIVSFADLRGAIGFSSFAVLLYYAIANASALRLEPHERRWPRALAVLGVVGCVTLACTLPARSVVPGTALGVVGLAVFASRATLRSRQTRVHPS